MEKENQSNWISNAETVLNPTKNSLDDIKESNTCIAIVSKNVYGLVVAIGGIKQYEKKKSGLLSFIKWLFKGTDEDLKPFYDIDASYWYDYPDSIPKHIMDMFSQEHKDPIRDHIAGLIDLYPPKEGEILQFKVCGDFLDGTSILPTGKHPDENPVKPSKPYVGIYLDKVIHVRDNEEPVELPWSKVKAKAISIGCDTLDVLITTPIATRWDLELLIKSISLFNTGKYAGLMERQGLKVRLEDGEFINTVISVKPDDIYSSPPFTPL